MFRIVLAAMMIAIMAGVGAMLSLLPVTAQQDDPSANRSFSPATVAPGERVTVTITVANSGQAGSVVETLPSEFTWVSSTHPSGQVDRDGQEVTFTLFGETSLTYSVTASSTEGQYSFSGTLWDFDGEEHDVLGPPVTVRAAPAPAQDDPSANRSFSPATVAPGERVTVTITVANSGQAGSVVETLPSEFTWVSSTHPSGQVDRDGQEVTFTLFGETSLTYSVTASSTEGQYSFSGTLWDFDGEEHDVLGPPVTVRAAPAPAQDDPSANRSFSPATVAPGERVTVTITVANSGQAGSVVETLPSEFTWVSSTHPSGQVDRDGQEVTFTLFGETSLTYSVTASSTERQYSFSGTLWDFDGEEHDVLGPPVTVRAAPAPAQDDPSANRSFSPATVAPGERVTVTITVANSGQAGSVVETLPSEFTWVSSTHPSGQVDRDGQEVTFTLFGETSLTYSVTASSTEGQYSSRSIDENSASGANVGDAVRATDADGDTVTYSLTGTDAGSFTINSSGQIMVGTGTMLDFEDKASYTVTVGATDPDNASDTIAVTITVGNADDPGMVTIMPDTTPQVGTELTASLEDQDGSVANLTWQWQKDDGQGSYTDIPGATMMSYTPVMADDGSRLQATAMYDDSFGEDKTAMGMTANAVGATCDIVSRYDTDGTPGISEIEASIAVLDYLIRGEITRDQAIQVVTAYRENRLIVGHLNTVTGSLSYFGPEQNNGVELAALHVNQAGGVLGVQMIIVTGDTATNPAQGVAAARALVDVEGAVAIVGALASSVTLAVAQSVTVPKQRLLISPASTSPAITVLEDDDFLFRTTVSDAAQGVVLARLAREIGYETAGIMLINNAYGEGLADQFEETFASLGGRVTGKVPHEDSQPTYTSELEKATEGDPDVLLAISYPGQAEVYLRESLEGGYSDTFLFVDGTKSPEMMEVVGWDALEGMLGTAQGSPDSPSLREFQRSYAAVHGAPPEHPFIAENYDAAVLIALAAAKAGTTTDSVAIRDALRSIANPPGEAVGPGVEGIKKALMLIAEGKDINYEGAAGTVDFDENGDVTGYIEIWKVEGGEIKSTGRFELP